jgi:hypothetical protein
MVIIMSSEKLKTYRETDRKRSNARHTRMKASDEMMVLCMSGKKLRWPISMEPSSGWIDKHTGR